MPCSEKRIFKENCRTNLHWSSSGVCRQQRHSHYTYDTQTYWNENIIVLLKFSLSDAPEVVKMTNTSAARIVVKMKTFASQSTSSQHALNHVHIWQMSPQLSCGSDICQTLHWRHNGRDASQITSLTIVYSIVYSDADQRKHQSSASLAFVCGIHPGPVNSPHKWQVTRKMFPFDDVIMKYEFDSNDGSR